MLKRLFRLSIFLIAFIVALLIVFFSSIHFLNPNEFKHLVEKTFQEQTGQSLNLDGNIRIQWFPFIKLHIDSVSLKLITKDDTIKIQAKEAQCELNWRAFFSKKVHVKSIESTQLSIQRVLKEQIIAQLKITDFYADLISSKDRLNFPHFSFKLGEDKLEGNINIAFFKDATDITASLQASKWNFPMEMVSFFDVQADKKNNFIGTLALKVDDFAIEKINFNEFSLAYNLKSKLLNGKAKKMHFQDAYIEDLTFTGNAAEKRFVLSSHYAGGVLSGNLLLNKGDAYEVSIDLEKVVVGTLFKQWDPESKIEGGRLKASLKGITKGKGKKELLAQFNGKAFVEMNNVVINEKSIDSRYVDVFSALWKNVTPKSKKTILECGVARFDIANNILNAHTNIGMQTADLNVWGAGQLNLASLELSFLFDIHPRSNVNLEAGSFNNIVYLQGTLEQPKIIASMEGALKELGSVAVGLTTGGLSLIAEKLMKLVTQKESPCEKARLAQ